MERYINSAGNFQLKADLLTGCITSLQAGGRELTAGSPPLFRIRLMDTAGKCYVTDAFAATTHRSLPNGMVYGGFPYDIEVTVQVGGEALADWHISVHNNTDMLVEWIDFPIVTLRPLSGNGGDAQVLLPYNEGVLIDDVHLRQASFLADLEPEYPSLGTYSIFPNMMCSQFLCYLFDGQGLYLGAHDTARGVKGIHLRPDGGGVSLYFKLFCGNGFGADGGCAYPVVWRVFSGGWQDGADIYKTWFETHLPQNVKKITQNDKLPAWYAESPIVVTYPVRGVHDMDNMAPNALFPYDNALPLIDEISQKTGSKLLVLLMHWEGSAPWAPPYVWPPYGGQELFDAFADHLHQRGHAFGVYCSGFGYTIKSNLVDGYHMEQEYQDGGTADIPACYATAWEADGTKAQIFVNHTEQEQAVTCMGKTIQVPALDAVLLPL